MKKIRSITITAVLAASIVSGVSIANELRENSEIYKDLAQLCEYYPQECSQTILGAGNGGGNEPPYTPRKPKDPKEPIKEITQ